ncbi:hypothetical protein MTO96_033096 [Rhipicephalus appendiculatus]
MYGPTAYKVFLSGGSKYQTTTLGLSLKLGTLPTDITLHKTELMTAMSVAINSDKIVHFGMLNVDIRNYTGASHGGLQFLTVIGEVLKGISPPQQCALGITNATDGKALVAAAKQAVSDFPAITMIILEVHTEKSPSPDKIYPVAPNPDTATLPDKNVITLNDIKDHVKDLKDIPKKGTYLMISIAMYARAYLFNYKGTLDYAKGSMILDYGVVCDCERTDVCNRTTDPSDKSGTTAFDNRNNVAIDFFDGPSSTEAKAKTRLEILPNNHTGIVAYNVEMDDYKQQCDDSPFMRLNSIKKEVLKAINEAEND